MRRIVLLAALASLAGGAASAQLTPLERRQVDAWLICFDCRFELDTVLVIARRKPAVTEDTLARALLAGPAAGRIVAAESALTIGYVRDSTYRRQQGLPPGPQRNTVVARSLGRYVGGYRARAAYALGSIRTPPALAALDSALQIQLPPPVRRAVLFARDSLHVP